MKTSSTYSKSDLGGIKISWRFIGDTV